MIQIFKQLWVHFIVFFSSKESSTSDFWPVFFLFEILKITTIEAKLFFHVLSTYTGSYSLQVYKRVRLEEEMISLWGLFYKQLFLLIK